VRLTALLLTLALATPAVASVPVLNHSSLSLSPLDQSMLNRSALNGWSDGATPVFDSGDPTTVTWGLPSQGMVDGMTLLAQYVGSDVTASGTETWTGTGTLAVTLTSLGDGTTAAGRSSVVPDVASVVTPNDRFQAASAPGVAYGTQDLVIEALVRASADTGGEMIVSNTSMTRNGAELFTRNIGDGRSYCQVKTTTGTTSVYSTGNGTTENAWQLIVCMYDRDGYMALTSSAIGDFNIGAAHVAMPDDSEDLHNSTDPFTIGGRSSTDIINYSTDIAWVRVWGCNGCLAVDDTPSEYNDDFATLLARVSGHHLDTGGAPSTATRSSHAWLRVCDPDTDTITYHQVGANWPRREVDCGYSNFTDPTASATTVASFLQEASSTSTIDYNTDLTNAAFNKAASTIVDDNSVGPLGLGCDGIIPDATSNNHGVSFTGPNFNNANSMHFVVKNTDATYPTMRIDRATAYQVEWDLTDGSVERQQDNAVAYPCADLGDDYWYCHFDDDTSTGSGNTFILACEAFDDCLFTGDASTVALEVCIAWGSYSTGVSSPVVTVDATDVTRSADSLSHALADLTSDQTLIVDFATPGTIGTVYGALLWDGSTSNRHLFWLNTVGVRHFSFSGGVTQVNQTNGTDVDDGARHIFRGTLSVGASVAYVDGSSTLTDTPAANPIALDTIYLGQSNTGLHLGGPLYRFRVFDQAIAPGEQGTGDDTP